MNKGLIVGSIIIISAGGIATGLLDGKNKANIIPVDNPEEYAIAPTSVLAHDKVVYVVGLEKMQGGQLADSEVGRTVIYEDIDIPDNVTCPVLLDSLGEDKPSLEIFNEENNFPCFKIENSCSGGRCIWYCILHGNFCKDILTYNDYIGSTMEDFKNLDFNLKRRFLRKASKCGRHDCLVPIEENDTDYIFPMRLAGREDLSYMNVNNNQVNARFESVSVDGGIQEAEAIDINPGGGRDK